ncbi:MAG TPA: hypothetical protein VFC14_09130 [Burkholderiales bacterium]|jgi:hypothetical protein|nr:hypothetical protein [Burkholderiales bacterium]
MSSSAQGLITVWLDVPPDREEEFNAWYDLEHLAQVVALPGFVSARRYRCDEAPIRYLAWYDTVDEKVETGPAFQRLVAEPTPWSQRMRRLYGDKRERFNFRLMRDVGQAPDRDTPWLYLVHTDIPDHIVGEYNEWYDKEHLPRLVTVPGVVRARRYTAVSGSPRYLTAYELTDKDAFESPEGLKARKTPWTEKMRSLFQNTRRSMCRLILPSVRERAWR